jgi:glycosyltransferase 2 family protein
MVRELGRRPKPGGHAPQRIGAPVSEHPRIPGDPASGIDDHANRRRSWHRTCRQLRIIGGNRLGADDHGIHQCPQPVQVLPVFGA